MRYVIQASPDDGLHELSTFTYNRYQFTYVNCLRICSEIALLLVPLLLVLEDVPAVAAYVIGINNIINTIINIEILISFIFYPLYQSFLFTTNTVFVLIKSVRIWR